MAELRFRQSTDQALTEPVSESYDYEWLYPNSQDGKYFTTTQARMYIGNLFIDELNTVQFAYQGNRIPVYGYCSEDYDAVGSGKRLVQGQILINFISEGYLYTVLSEYERLMLQKTQADVTGEEIANRANEYGLTAKGTAAVGPHNPYGLSAAGAASLGSGTNPYGLRASGTAAIGTTPTLGGGGTAAIGKGAALQGLDQEITRLAAQGGPEAVEKARELLVNRDRLTAPRNALTLKVPFDIVMELWGGGRKVTRKLEGCVLTANEQIFDQSGQTLVDAYGFIARRLV